MLYKITLFFVNLVYLVPRKVRKFERENPGIEVIAAGATKARKMAADTDPRYEYGWALAKRRTLILAADGLHCGNWFIPLAEIQEATLFRISSGLVIKLSTTTGLNYQFGLQYDPQWEKQSLIPFKLERGELSFSIFSLLVRLVILVYLIWVIVQDIIQQEIDLYTFILAFFVIYFIVPIIKRLLPGRQLDINI